MSSFKPYCKRTIQWLRPYIPGEDLAGISVNAVDTPEAGGMIAMNADNPKDQWYVGKDFYQANYEPAQPQPEAESRST